VWSIGCTLYELYTGKILFPGRSNNQMLLLMMELRGRFTSKMIKRAQFGNLYFDEAGAFNAIEINRVTGSVRSYVHTRVLSLMYLGLDRIPRRAHLEPEARSSRKTNASSLCKAEG
jgi:serine/threonine protein kinase